MRDVVLLYERSCPNVRAARANLLRAFSEAKVPASWREVDVDAPSTPAAWRGFGSPTVLVDGVDVDGGAPTDGATCRVYEQDGKISRAPSVDRIVAALRPDACGSTSRHALPPVLAGLPGVGIALLPNVVCPACWPAYAAVLSALGLGVLMQSRYLLPITIVVMAGGTFAIGRGARARRGVAPAITAGIAAALLLIGKFVLDATWMSYGATAAFAVASVWNAWPRKLHVAERADAGSCCAGRRAT